MKCLKCAFLSWADLVLLWCTAYFITIPNHCCLSFWISPYSVLILIARHQTCLLIRSFRWKGTRQRPEFDQFNRKGLLKPGVKASGKGANPRDPPLFQQKRRTGA